MEMGDSTVLFQTPLWLTGSCYLTSPATVCTQQATLQLAPLLSLSVSPQGDGTLMGTLQSYHPPLASTEMALP